MDERPNLTAAPRQPNDLAKLIRKLHWAGLEDEARQLQLAMLALPRGERGIVLAGPCDTD